MNVLGIQVSAELLCRQASWFAPQRRPFILEEKAAGSIGEAAAKESITAETRDTFEIYNLPDGDVCVFLDEEEFSGLPRNVRIALVRSQLATNPELVPSVRSAPAAIRAKVAEQADGHRFIWWPSLLSGHQEEVLSSYLAAGRRNSRHEEVPVSIWQQATTILPGAKELAGRYPEASGPNCFGAVMAAAGVEGAASTWMFQEPFENWLREASTPGGHDDDPGTVLVWRSRAGLAQHAAVTIGGGYALHKPSQGWMSPWKILTVQEVIWSARYPDRLLRRHTLVPASH
ncbi:hypothetical protein [Psychromicrobium lacuslunae]|uniref:Uncharacterized protein n=1 Tax=Psychromicrobium lacuslunae TaxID=1618207 RepID=A0A0D4C0K7_9MICC|nr:hypothetical protein [Psychromicrobium lacuslunae]AJT42108.1 hypothetical protein UM93_12410 [Psychromicrobium lacuslunae]